MCRRSSKGVSFLVCLVVLVSMCLGSPFAATVEKNIPDTFPSRVKPLWIDKKDRRVLLYTELNQRSLSESNPHWGIVFKDGKLAGKSIFSAYSAPLDFHDALVKIGARPGNNLSVHRNGQYVGGDRLAVSVTWPGLNRQLTLREVIFDSTGHGFDIRFGGNRGAALEAQTGCILCLESCPIAITSNAAYPAIGTFKRLISPNSLFKGRPETLPNVDHHPVIFIFRLASPGLSPVS